MRWSWGADLGAPIAQALMEATWLYAWALVIATVFGASSPGFGAMVLLFAFGAWSGRLSGLVRWRYPYNLLPLLLVTLIALSLWLHTVLLPQGGWGLSNWSARLLARHGRGGAEFVAIGILALYLWGRGVWIGVWPPSTETLGKWLIGGAAAFLALFALVAAAPDIGIIPIEGRLEFLVLGYFVLALSVMAIVHSKTLHGRITAGQPTSLARGLALVFPMTTIAVLALWLSSDLIPVMRTILAPASSAIRASVAAAAHALGQILLWTAHQLLMFLDWLSPTASVGLSQASAERPKFALSVSEISIWDKIIFFLRVYTLSWIPNDRIWLTLSEIWPIRLVFLSTANTQLPGCNR